MLPVLGKKEKLFWSPAPSQAWAHRTICALPTHACTVSTGICLCGVKREYTAYREQVGGTTKNILTYLDKWYVVFFNKTSQLGL